MYIFGVARCGAVLLAIFAAGCSLTGSGGSATMQVGSLDAKPAIGESAPQAPVSMGPLLEGPIGSRLAESDRNEAFKAETAALESGERRTWRGAKGTYGFVVPETALNQQSGGDECRGFTHTIYFAGRPQTGTGRGCRGADGDWHIVG